MFPSDYRETARDMLSKRWLLSAWIYFLGALFGASLAGAYLCHPEMLINELLQLPSAELWVPYIPTFLWDVLRIQILLIQTLFTAQLMVGGLVDLGVARFTLNLHDGHPVRVRTLLSQSANFANALMLFYYKKIRTLGWTLLGIVPGFIAHYRYALAPFLMCDYPEFSAHRAIEESKELMEGHKMELFKLELSFAGWYALSIVTLGIGFIFLKPYVNSARVAFYRELCPMELDDE